MSLGEFIGMTLGAWKMAALGASLGGMIGAPGGPIALASAAVGGAIGIGAGIYGGGWAGRKLVAWLMDIETPEQVDERQTEELAGMDVQIEDLMAQKEGLPATSAKGGEIDSQIAALKTKRTALFNKRDFTRASNTAFNIQSGNALRSSETTYDESGEILHKGWSDKKRVDYLHDTAAFDRDLGMDDVDQEEFTKLIKSGEITSLDIQALLREGATKRVDLKDEDRTFLQTQVGVAKSVEADAIKTVNSSVNAVNTSIQAVTANSRPHLVTDIGLAMKNGNLGNFANTQISADQNTNTNINYSDNSMAVYNRDHITQSLNSSVLALQS